MTEVYLAPDPADAPALKLIHRAVPLPAIENLDGPAEREALVSALRSIKLYIDAALALLE